MNIPHLNICKKNCKNAESLARKITTIPVHPGLNNSELDYVIDRINTFA